MAEVRRVEEKRRNELTLPARLGRQGKSEAIRRTQWIGMIELFDHRRKALAIRFDQNINHINVETAIHLCCETAGKRKGALG
jgi:hypothetical protein